VGYLLCRRVIYPRVRSVAETRRLEIEAHNLDPQEFEQWPREELSLRSAYGYDLYACYLPLKDSQKTVVISHGITYSLYGSIKYVPLFRKRGFNVLLYDLRHHGRSGGPNTTFGFYERHDLRLLVDWALQRLGPGGKVGTMGESLGAAVTIMEAKEDPHLSFAIADCPYSDLADLFDYRQRVQYPWLPRWPFFFIANWFCRRITGMSFEDVSPIGGIEALATPLLLTHGREDRYIPPEMSIAMFDNKRLGLRRIYLAPDARHAESLVKNPVEYDRTVGEFLHAIGLY
jgi:hypothetical protein